MWREILYGLIRSCCYFPAAAMAFQGTVWPGLAWHECTKAAEHVGEQNVFAGSQSPGDSADFFSCVTYLGTVSTAIAAVVTEMEFFTS